MRSTRIGLRLAAVASLAVFVFACADGPTDAPEVDGPAFAKSGGDAAAEIAGYMDVLNADLANSDAGYLAVMAEYITDGESGEVGNLVIAKDVGNKQLAFDFVPFDARRAWGDPGGGITYAIDGSGDAEPFAGGLTAAQTDAAIVRGMNSWDAEQCSDLPLTRVQTGAAPLGVIVGEGLAADVQHAGWRDLEFSGGVLAVTFTFGFCAPCGADPVWTDIDGNGKADAAFREIYYDPFVGTFGPPRVWADDGTSNFDVETIALHEAGHGLSQAHFGKVFVDRKGNLKFAPKAVMNAVYVGPQRTLLGTDNGGHCSIWANWPNN